MACRSGLKGGERRGGEGGSLKMWVDSHGGRPSEDIGKWLARGETKWRQWWCGVAVAVAVVVNLDRQIRRPTCRVGQVRRVHRLGPMLVRPRTVQI